MSLCKISNISTLIQNSKPKIFLWFFFFFFKWPQGSTMYFENFFKKIKITFYIYIYIYIYIIWDQVTLDIILSNITPPNKFLLN